MKKNSIIMALFFLLILSSCTKVEEEITIESTEQFIENFKNNPVESDSFYKNKLLIFYDEIDFITWPKDGRKLNYTSITFGNSNYNRVSLDGDCVSIEIDERRKDLAAGDFLKVKAKYQRYAQTQKDFYIILKNGIVINENSVDK